MKHLFTTLSISLLLSTSFLQADPPPSTTTQVTKVGAGIVATAALSYTLWKLYQDMNQPKRYAQTAHYIKDNADQLTRDGVTTIGLGYLTWLSGSYTYETLSNLLEEEDEEEEDDSSL